MQVDNLYKDLQASKKRKVQNDIQLSQMIKQWYEKIALLSAWSPDQQVLLVIRCYEQKVTMSTLLLLDGNLLTNYKKENVKRRKKIIYMVGYWKCHPCVVEHNILPPKPLQVISV